MSRKLWLYLMLSLVLVVGMPAVMAGNGNGNGDGVCDGSGSGSTNGGSGGQNGGNGGSGNQGGQGYQGDRAGESHYDPATVMTINGVVSGLGCPLATGSGNQRGENFILTGEDGMEYTVVTAPFWFMENQELTFEVGDAVTVTGSLWEHDDDGGVYCTDLVLISAEIVKGDLVLVLRDELGTPLWKATRGAGAGANRPDTFPRFTYDITVEEVLSGTVGGIFIGPLLEDTYPGYQLSLILDDGRAVPVILGPYWYLFNQGLELEAGMAVVVTGVFITLEDGSEVFLAQLLEYDDTVVVLRDETGVPLWTAVRHRYGN